VDCPVSLGLNAAQVSPVVRRQGQGSAISDQQFRAMAG
jgi:hypothetical protein